MSMATGFAAGLIAAWGAVWSTTWLLLNRPQFDAKRIQRRWVKVEVEGAEVDTGKSLSSAIPSDESTTKQRGQNGHAKLKTNSHAMGNGNTKGLGHEASKGQIIYYWQSYPENLKDRIPWVLDLTFNFRGPGWNWAIPPLPSPPTYVTNQLSSHVDSSSRTGQSSIGLQRYDTFSALARARIPQFVIGYFVLDILKVIMLHDPYFIFGPTTYRLPSYLQGLSPLTLHFTRQAISSASIIVSLEMTFILAPIGFSLILGPRVLGLRAEPWYYPTTWGNFSMILDKGLNGLWGSWWHQTFRFAFSAPSNFLIKNGYIKAKSTIAKMSALFFAFGISGILHSAGSISQFPKTKPHHAPIFFMLQAVGILLQTTACSILHPLIKTFPRPIRQAGNLFFVIGWLLCTGWWLTDDFARGGIWLYEPIPISPLRGLGFGEKDAGWWCWEHIGVGWYKGKHWWESGIAI